MGGHAEAQRRARGGAGDYLGDGAADDDVDEGACHHHGNHDEAQKEQCVGKALRINACIHGGQIGVGKGGALTSKK